MNEPEKNFLSAALIRRRTEQRNILQRILIVLDQRERFEKERDHIAELGACKNVLSDMGSLIAATAEICELTELLDAEKLRTENIRLRGER